MGDMSRRRASTPVALAGAAVLALLAMLAGAGRPAAAADPAPGALPAVVYRDLGLSSPVSPFPAPVFRLKDLAGQSVSLTDLKGRAVLLYFWTTW
jgi:cytochrome oxidase Cu insertion factor (SCO1/SenC/PrrC family)